MLAHPSLLGKELSENYAGYPVHTPKMQRHSDPSPLSVNVFNAVIAGSRSFVICRLAKCFQYQAHVFIGYARLLHNAALPVDAEVYAEKGTETCIYAKDAKPLGSILIDGGRFLQRVEDQLAARFS